MKIMYHVPLCEKMTKCGSWSRWLNNFNEEDYPIMTLELDADRNMQSCKVAIRNAIKAGGFNFTTVSSGRMIYIIKVGH